MALEIKTAAELIAPDVEGRQAFRRAARETELLQRVFWAFVDRAEPVRLDAIVSGVPDQPPERVLEALSKLDEEDLVRIRAGRGERCACCAVDALGMAPMPGEHTVSGRGAIIAPGPWSCRWIPRALVRMRA